MAPLLPPGATSLLYSVLTHCIYFVSGAVPLSGVSIHETTSKAPPTPALLSWRHCCYQRRQKEKKQIHIGNYHSPASLYVEQLPSRLSLRRRCCTHQRLLLKTLFPAPFVSPKSLKEKRKKSKSNRRPLRGAKPEPYRPPRPTWALLLHFGAAALSPALLT